MSSHTMEDLTSCILDFQANIVRITHQKKVTPVDPLMEPSHAADLTFIWESANLEEDVDDDGHVLKWRKLGFDSEDIEHEFSEVGVLGLDCMVNVLCMIQCLFLTCTTQKHFIKSDPDFSKVRQISYHPFHKLKSVSLFLNS